MVCAVCCVCVSCVFFSLLPRGLQEKFLHDRIKVNGKTNNLQGVIGIQREGNKINVTSEGPFTKR